MGFREKGVEGGGGTISLLACELARPVGRGTGIVVGWGLVEGRMDKTKQNQEEVVGKDTYGFREREGQDTLLPKSVAGGRNLEQAAPASRTQNLET